MSIDFILDNINYDLLFENGTKMTGDITYVTHHLSDDTAKAIIVSSSQKPEIAKYLAAYNKYIQNVGQISIVEFYKIWSKGENA